MEVRTRFAPSPTGYLHIGGIRTALFAWLFARHHAGEFLLRIEDTDRERSTQEAVDVILEGMDWLGMSPDEEVRYQSQRSDRYREVIQHLLDEDKAYHCYCSREELDAMRAEAMAKGEKPRYNGKCRNRNEKPATDISPVVRFRNPPEGNVVVDDLIQGQVVFNNAELDDLIIARSDGSPTYNLCVVVDDMDMNITHVMRGDDHLNNTPRQINMFSALGAALPQFAHIPMILGPDGKKLSKRHGTVSVLQYRDEGFLPEALLNYLARLGWSHGDQEIFSIQDLIDLFDIADVNKSASAINPDKLLWLNQHYIKTAPAERLSELAEEYLRNAGIDISRGPALSELMEVQKERLKTLADLAAESRYFYEDFDEIDPAAAKKHLRGAVLEALTSLTTGLRELENWDAGSIHTAITDTATAFEMKMGKIAQPLRVAVTGGSVSPSIDATLTLIGRDRCLQRLEKALEYIRERQQT